MKIFKKIITFLLGTEICILNQFSCKALNIDITAPSAILIDISSGKTLYEKNSHQIRDCASLTKIMSLALVLEAINSGKISLNSMVSASERASSIGGSHVWLKCGESMSVRDLIKASVVASANDATLALAEAVSGSEAEFVKAMNAKAKALGMKETVFKECNGLDKGENLTSAHDVAVMSRELAKYPEIFNFTTMWIEHLRDGKTQIVNTNRLIKTYKGITGLKTGTTEKAGSCISASAQRNNLNLISVALGCKSGKDRFSDAAALLDFGFANYAVTKPDLPNELIEIKVKGGMQATVNAKVSASGNILIHKDKGKNILNETQICENIEAPIIKGQNLGKIIYKMDKEILAQYPIVATEDVQKVNFRAIFNLLFASLISF